MSITNYHWNNGQGAIPGTISLRDSSGNTLGTWTATTRPGQGGVPNANWDVRPNVTLSPGTYTIIDSDPSTWSQNSQSNNVGMSVVKGTLTIPTPTPTATPAPASTEADAVIQVGDIDNLGFGWPTGFDVFSGASTPVHSYPFQPDANDANGTDRIMVGTSYNGNPPHGQDGYTSTTSRPGNLPQAIDMRYSLGGIQVRSATIQMFVDDFQSPVWGSSFQVTLNGQRAPFLENVINALDQTGPIGKLITVQIPADFLPLVASGHLSIYIDDPTTGAGDGYAVDFVRLLINPHITTVGNVSGRVTDATTGLALQGATVSASGTVTTVTGSDGAYILRGVPAGLVVVNASKNGYVSRTISNDLVAGSDITMDFTLNPVPTPTPTPVPTPIPSGVLRQWASGAFASSEYSPESWSAAQATGAPDTFSYGDIGTAWATLGSDDGIHWIELNYTYLVYATGVNVRETYNPGALIKIDLKDYSGTYHTVWTGSDPNTGIPDSIGWSNITFAQTTYPTNTVRLYLNTSLVPGWNEIDAVELVGISAGITTIPTPTPVPASFRLAATPTTVSPGDTITVSFTAPGYQNDWIAMYSVGADNTAYGEWSYLEGRTSGTLSFTAPSVPGNYEFRLFPNWNGTCCYNDIARSNRITVTTAAPTPTVTATPAPVTGNVNVSNRYIDIVVAPSGSYTMGTTGGDPGLRTDDNKLLLYGYPNPWSSYLTVRIDGTNYYTKDGSMNQYRVSGPAVSGNSIITAWRIGDIGVTQTISITTSSTTGRQDTALFKVSLTNNGNAAHSVGARFLFDTMLGYNDAAPFRVQGIGDVTTEREFNGSDVPSYWQAFDSLSNPTVISQGTLATQTPPGRFIIANWGHLNAAPWDYSVQWGSPNGDSATAVYWNPVSIQPGRSVEYATAYGLGGVTVSQGVLSLGISSPTNVGSGDAFTITAYTQNTGSTAVNNVNALMTIPSGIVLVPGETLSKPIGTLNAGGEAQVSWNVQAQGTGAINFSVSISGSNAPTTSASRTINVAPIRTSTAIMTRSISPPAIQPGSTLNITLTPSPSTSFDQPGYQVTEVIPQGFIFVGTDAGVTHVGSIYTFIQIGSDPVNYTLTAPSTSGSYTITGTFKDEFRNTGTVSGTTSINVGSAGTGDLRSRYDTNHDGIIGRSEAIAAVADYFNGALSRQEAISVVTMYFTG